MGKWVTIHRFDPIRIIENSNLGGNRENCKKKGIAKKATFERNVTWHERLVVLLLKAFGPKLLVAK